MLRAVILDNSAIARGLLRTILADGGYDIVNESGVAACSLPKLVLLDPQLVFLSLDAEDHDCLATLGSLRAGLPKALIVAISSEFTPDKLKQSIERGANTFVVKPFNGATVLSAVRSAVIKLIEQKYNPGN